MKNSICQYGKTLDDILGLKEVAEEKLCEPISEGKWSIIQIVGHLYYWDKYILENMVSLMAEDADLPQFPDHDKHNEEAMSFLKDYSIESIIDRFIDTRKDLIERISRLGADVRFSIGGGKRKFSVESFIKIFTKHDAHHLKQIHKKLHK